MKPHIIFVMGKWLCHGRGSMGTGDTPSEALCRWYIARISAQ